MARTLKPGFAYVEKDLVSKDSDFNFVRLRASRAQATVGAMITKLLHTRYRVNDLEKTIRFYTEVLGVQENPPQQERTRLGIGVLESAGERGVDRNLHYPASGPVQVQPDLTHLAFEVEDWNQFEIHLRKLGLPVSDGPHHVERGEVIAFIDAPEGYEVELIQHPKGE